MILLDSNSNGDVIASMDVHVQLFRSYIDTALPMMAWLSFGEADGVKHGVLRSPTTL